MNFPDPDATPNKKFKGEKFLDGKGIERIRYSEDLDFDQELEDRLYDHIVRQPIFAYDVHATG